MPTPVDEGESSMPIIPEASSMISEAMESNGAEEGGGGNADAEETSEKVPHKHRQRPRKQKLYSSIRNQMEFYFSDANITKQRMMKSIVLASEYVDLQIFLEKFNKVSQLSKNIEDFRRALKHSDKLELSEDELGVRRKVPFDESKVKSEEAVEACTIYVENIPSDATHDWVEKTFQEFGKVAYVSLPKFKRNSQPKGFAFVEFEEEEAAQHCLKAYGEVGACLSSNIDPAGLLSVTSYNEDIKPKYKRGKSPKNIRKRKHGPSESSQNDETSEAVKAKKNKPEDEIDAEAKSLVDKAEQSDAADTGKKKLDKKVIPDDSMKCEASHVGADAKIKPEPDSSTLNTEVIETEVTKTKKKRRRNKTKAGDVTEEKQESDLIHLRILPKKHWRQLRNRYLNLQRENMGKLKAQLKTEENRRFIEPPAPVPYKSICVKISLSSPAESVEMFKSQIVNELVPLDWFNLVKHVEYEEGNLEAIVRMDGSLPGRSGVNVFVQNAGRVFKNVQIMTKEETDTYWNDLRRTLKDKQKQKIRGKDRILNQAMKVGSSHIHFDDGDDSG